VQLCVKHVVARRGSGFQNRQWLVQRDGRFIQVTELLYRIAEYADGERPLDGIADRVTGSTEWLVTGDQVRDLIRTRLLPLGILAPAEGAFPSGSVATPTRSPLQVKMRVKLLGPQIIDPLTRVLRYLFAPPLLVPVLLGVAVAHWWLYRDHGMGRAIRDVLSTPGALLVVVAISLVSAVVHEFGHASALRYGGGRVRGMGAGVYLVYPVLYTDTTDGYRLGRWGRVRTDLGGFYFHLIFAVGVMGLYGLTGREYLLVAVLGINLDVLRQCLPFVRFDGYWALADLTGIPDFFSQMGAFLRSVLPLPAWKGSKLPRLKPWVKAVFATYVAVGIPVLAVLLFLTVRRVPKVVADTWDALQEQGEAFSGAQRGGDVTGVAVAVSQMVLLALPLLFIAYFLSGLAWRLVRAAYRQPTWPRRLAGGVSVAAVAGLVAWLWVPHLPLGNATAPAGVERFAITERDHVEGPVPYARVPPVGGDHAPIWQNCGVYDAPVRNENAVHSLEHGAVWIAYRPDLPADQVEAVRDLVRGQTHVLVSPYPDLPAPVIASAWGVQLRLDSAGDPRLGEFVRAFRLGPQAPERGGPCTGGVGTPMA